MHGALPPGYDRVWLKKEYGARLLCTRELAGEVQVVALWRRPSQLGVAPAYGAPAGGATRGAGSHTPSDAESWHVLPAAGREGWLCPSVGSQPAPRSRARRRAARAARRRARVGPWTPPQPSLAKRPGGAKRTGTKGQSEGWLCPSVGSQPAGELTRADQPRAVVLRRCALPRCAREWALPSLAGQGVLSGQVQGPRDRQTTHRQTGKCAAPPRRPASWESKDPGQPSLSFSPLARHAGPASLAFVGRGLSHCSGCRLPLGPGTCPLSTPWPLGGQSWEAGGEEPRTKPAAVVGAATARALWAARGSRRVPRAAAHGTRGPVCAVRDHSCDREA